MSVDSEVAIQRCPECGNVYLNDHQFRGHLNVCGGGADV